MTERPDAPTDPPPPAAGPVAPARLLELLVLVGEELTASGDAVSDARLWIERIAAAFGAPGVQVSVFPTTVLVSLPGEEARAVELGARQIDALRLDQVDALFEVVKLAAAGSVSVETALRALRGVRNARPRFAWPLTLAGHGLLTVGLSLILGSTALDLLVCAGFGLGVGALKLLAMRIGALQLLLPVLAAVLVSATAFWLGEHTAYDGALRALIPPLVTFLPGAALTMAIVELTAGDMMAGSSRFVFGMIQLGLLAFGIVIGAQLVGLPAGEQLVGTTGNLIGAWAPWAGVLIFGLGVFLHFSAPPRSPRWIMLVLAAAWVGQWAGGAIVSGYLSGFFGAVAMTPVALAAQRARTGPPALVTFMPAFWMLVPGALGLVGLTDFAQDSYAGVQELVATAGAIVSIALGVLVGAACYQYATLRHTVPGQIS